jgi:hypothetical protein
MFTTKYSKKQPAKKAKAKKRVQKFAEGGEVKPLQIKNTWMDLDQNSQGGPSVPTPEERRARGDRVKRSGYPR